MLFRSHRLALRVLIEGRRLGPRRAEFVTAGEDRDDLRLLLSQRSEQGRHLREVIVDARVHLRGLHEP